MDTVHIVAGHEPNANGLDCSQPCVGPPISPFKIKGLTLQVQGLQPSDNPQPLTLLENCPQLKKACSLTHTDLLLQEHNCLTAICIHHCLWSENPAGLLPSTDWSQVDTRACPMPGSHNDIHDDGQLTLPKWCLLLLA